MIINNGLGVEMRMGAIVKSEKKEEDSYPFITAKGHFGNKSEELIRHYAEDLGFEYLCASSKNEYLSILPRFTTADMTEKPVVFEVFASDSDENKALEMITNLESTMVGFMTQIVMKILSPKDVEPVRKP